MAEKILLVESEQRLLESLAYKLRRQGFKVESAGDVQAALEVARQTKPDLILLDEQLLGMDGLEFCRNLHQEMSIPVLMLTAREDEIDRLAGQEAGADDTLTRPFSIDELLVRIRALLRRPRLLREVISTGSAEITSQVITFEKLEINLPRREVRLNRELLSFKPMEFNLLVFLARNRGQMLSRETLLQNVWGWDFIGDTRTVDVHIRWLREKIEADPADPTRIITVRGTGYRFDG